MQENLLPESHRLHDAGREPRLWVHRLRLLERPGGPALRTLTLRRGMNVFWSPGGHGTGKSLLCGMIRYVLGDSSYADQETRGRLLAALPEAVVQAEILSAGERWAIQRALHGRRDGGRGGGSRGAPGLRRRVRGVAASAERPHPGGDRGRARGGAPVAVRAGVADPRAGLPAGAPAGLARPDR